MSDTQNNITPRRLFGRKQLFTNATSITKENIVKVLQEIQADWSMNLEDIKYLYRYYKGNQPSLYRNKQIRSDICNQIVENRAKEIVDFKVGYTCGSPIQYISRDVDEQITSALDELNKIMEVNGKSTKDRTLIEWQFICGTGYRMVLPSDEKGENANPIEIYTLDPRNTFVIYSNDYRRKPLAGVYFTNTIPELGSESSVLVEPIYEIYTETEFIKVKSNQIIEVKPNPSGITIFEYPANPTRMGAFETVISLLDALNILDCNRLDGVEQFIQSLIILYNCELPEDEDATSLQAKGLIELKSKGEAKADIKILSEQLNQTETETLKADLLAAIREIAGIPSQGDGSSSDSSNNGAALTKNGWEHCETHAKAFELSFKESEIEMLKLVLKIVDKLKGIKLSVKDMDIHFTRRNYENLLVKSQVLTTMLAQDKIAPKLAFEASGLFTDPEGAYAESMKWYEEQKAELPTEEEPEEVPTEEVEVEEDVTEV
jgi:SPP1 family phage portal protein